jgi:predicted amidohydrolase
MGQLRNRALILPEGYQDKLNLTEWEAPVFSRGSGVRIIHFAGLQVAVLICLDVEVPELAVALRGRGIDLLLVPSATDSIWGFERVNRCASARAVELGCAVVVAHLTGKGPMEMIDENIGATACYLPSQAEFERERRAQIIPPEPVASEWITQRFEIDIGALRAARNSGGETNPARLHPASVDVVLP